MYVFSVDGSVCERCFDCVTACPRSVLAEGDRRPMVIHPEECMGCYVCLVVCRTKGLKIVEVPTVAGLERLPIVA